MSDEYTDYEADFFQAVDRNTVAEQAIFDALMSIRDDQYYTLFEIEAEHTCGLARVQVFPERAGTLYRCLNCGNYRRVGSGSGKCRMRNGNPYLWMIPTPHSLLPIPYSRRLAQLHGLITAGHIV